MIKLFFIVLLNVLFNGINKIYGYPNDLTVSTCETIIGDAAFGATVDFMSNTAFEADGANCAIADLPLDYIPDSIYTVTINSNIPMSQIIIYSSNGNIQLGTNIPGVNNCAYFPISPGQFNIKAPSSGTWTVNVVCAGDGSGIATTGKNFITAGSSTLKPTFLTTGAPVTSNPTNPTKNPTSDPTKNPTKKPTGNPTKHPSNNPTKKPTKNPTKNPVPTTLNPTKNPTTRNPTKNPTTSNPTKSPTVKPTDAEITNSPTAPTTMNPTYPPRNHDTCFPGSGLVNLENGEKLEMQFLRPGIKVQVAHKKFEPILLMPFLDHDSGMNNTIEYYQIHFESGKSLDLSDKHYAMIWKGPTILGMEVPAYKVSIGDIGMVFGKNGLSYENVVSIEKVYLNGLFSPITQSFEIVVNDVLAGCGSENAVQREVAQNLLLPFLSIVFTMSPTAKFYELVVQLIVDPFVRMMDNIFSAINVSGKDYRKESNISDVFIMFSVSFALFITFYWTVYQVLKYTIGFLSGIVRFNKQKV